MKKLPELKCGTCTACCDITPSLHLHPVFDDPTQYVTTPDGKRLAPNGTGKCRYVMPGGGCMTHAHKPYLCRKLDCRDLIRNLSERERRDRLPKYAAVFKAARERMR